MNGDTDMSKPSDVARAIGRLEAGAEATHDRINELKESTEKRFEALSKHLSEQDAKLNAISTGIANARGGLGMLVSLGTVAATLVHFAIEYFRGAK